jgi:hypothetical protein
MGRTPVEIEPSARWSTRTLPGQTAHRQALHISGNHKILPPVPTCHRCRSGSIHAQRHIGRLYGRYYRRSIGELPIPRQSSGTRRQPCMGAARLFRVHGAKPFVARNRGA